MPTTPNKLFSIPTTGSEVGVWGSNDLNPNFSAIDSLMGSVTTINLVGAGTINLNATQQQAMVIRLQGTLTTSPLVVFNQPGIWIIDNQATYGGFVCQLSGGSGNVICTAPGSRTHAMWDGTNMSLLNQPEPGTFRKFPYSTTPNWMTANTVPPWIICRGGTIGTNFPALNAIIGATFGGNGSTTFGIPDLQGRAEFDIDNGVNRINSVGGTIGAGAGDQFLQSHNHTGSGNVTDPGHQHGLGGLITSPAVWAGGVNGAANCITSGGNSNVQSAGTSITVPSLNINNNGSGAGQNMPPYLVTGCTFIKT